MLRKRMSKKGFTLVEIVVVLVILAILAAIMIPSMVKWIDRAKDKSAIVAARTMLLAAQTIASEAYAEGTTDSTDDATTIAAAEALAALGSSTDLTGLTIDDGTVTSMTVTHDGTTVSYTPAGGFTT